MQEITDIRIKNTTTGETSECSFKDANCASALDDLDNVVEKLAYGSASGGKNLWRYGDVSGVGVKTVYTSLPSGTYSFQVKVTSSDTHDAKSLIDFKDANGNRIFAQALNRGTALNSATFTASTPIASIDFYAATTASKSANDSFTYYNFQIEEGSVLSDYKPYIASAKVTTESLSDYGLINRFDGIMTQGILNGSGGVEVPHSNAIYSNFYNVSSNGTVSIKYADANIVQIFVQYFNGSTFLSTDVASGNVFSKIAPTNATKFRFHIYKAGITPQIASPIGVYVDNAIDEITPVVLYEDSTKGITAITTKTITLSKPANQFSYLEIYYRYNITNNVMASVKVMSDFTVGDSLTIPLTSFNANGNNLVRVIRQLTISKTDTQSLVIGQGTSQAQGSAQVNNNNICIPIKIVGYK